MAFCSHHGGSVYISCSDNIRCGFGSHLCAWLHKQEIRITNDEAFTTGTLIELAREDAIRKSNVVIIIISKEYPTSKHCLDELEMILRYDEKKEILPIFYHIRSEDIRYQTGSFKNTFIELGKKFPEQMVKIWRKSFSEVAAKTAYKVNIDRDESRIVQDVTRDVCNIMKCVCSLDAKELNDAVLRPTTTHRTSSVPVSGALSKKKQVADLKAGKIPVKLRPQVGSQSEEHLEKLVYGKLPSKKIHRPEIRRGQVAEEDASHHRKSGSTNGTYVQNPSSCNVKKTASCRTSRVPSVSDVDSVSSTHLLINMQKILSCYNQTASTSNSFSDVNQDVDQQTLARDSVPSQSCFKKIRTALKTISDCFSRGSSVLQDFECLKTLEASLSYLSDLGPEEGISNEMKVAIELIIEKFKHMQERFEIAENTRDKASKLKAEKERASYDCQQYRCLFWELDADKKYLDEKETQLEGKQLALRNQLSDVQAKLEQSQAVGDGLVQEMQSCFDAAKLQTEVMNKCCKELKKLQPSIEEARKSKADVEATMEKFKNQACLESLLAEI